MKIAVATLGCKVNQYESGRIVDELSGGGYRFVEFNQIADVYIINTCAVTADADHKSRKLVGRASRLNPEAAVIVTGCYSELASDLLRQAGATHIFGNADKSGITDTVKDLKPVGNGCYPETEPPGRTRVVVKIQDGCDQFCSYCVIPYLRGRPSSRDPGEIVEEVKFLSNRGVKEVILTGIHLGKYGLDKKDISLPRLIDRLLDETDIARIRLSSLEMPEIEPALADLIAGSDRVADHLHIPLQSGSDKILGLMNRPYTSARYRQSIEIIRKKIPEIAVTTDIIVGFPGESESDFAATLDVVKTAGFRKLHVFQYSDRPLTKAADMPDKIDKSTTGKRAAALRTISDKQALEYAERQIGSEMAVVVEKRLGGDRFVGTSGNYMRVSVESKTDLKGEMVKVMINKVEKIPPNPLLLKGEIIK